MRALTIEERLPCFPEQRVSVPLAKTRREVPQNAVLSRKIEQSRFIRRGEETGEFLRIGL